MSIKITVFSVGSGQCALTGKAESDGLSVAFDGESATFLSWKALRQLLAMKAAQAKPEPKPEPKPAQPVIGPVAQPVKNGNA